MTRATRSTGYLVEPVEPAADCVCDNEVTDIFSRSQRGVKWFCMARLKRMSEDSQEIQFGQPLPNIPPKAQDLIDIFQLDEKQRLVEMVVGIWRAVERNHTPETIVQIAHSARELMEKTLRYYTDKVSPEYRLGDQVQKLHASYVKMCKREGSAKDSWRGDIGKYLSVWLSEVDTFFTDYKQSRPQNDEQVMAFAQKTNLAPVPIPDATIKQIQQEWKYLRDYFNNVAHHRSDAPSSEDIQIRLGQLVDLLASVMSTQPVPAMKKLDDLIREGEGGSA